MRSVQLSSGVGAGVTGTGMGDGVAVGDGVGVGDVVGVAVGELVADGDGLDRTGAMKGGAASAHPATARVTSATASSRAPRPCEVGVPITTALTQGWIETL